MTSSPPFNNNAWMPPVVDWTCLGSDVGDMMGGSEEEGMRGGEDSVSGAVGA
jgi:hypothetical protein